MEMEIMKMKKKAPMNLVITNEERTPTQAYLPEIEDGANKDGHIVDIEKWAASLARILEDVPEYMCRPGHPGRISKIPETLREVDTKSYEPSFISIGPYHQGKTCVQRMETAKKCVLKWVLKQKPEVTLKDFLKEIKIVESSARSFYSNVEMESEEFTRMLLLDSLFIVTMFCGMPLHQEWMNDRNSKAGNSMDNDVSKESMNQINKRKLAGDDNDKMQMMIRRNESINEMRSSEIHIYEPDEPRWLWILLEHDIFLLENQLPFFVLQKVHRLVYGGSETQLIDGMRAAFSKFLRHYRTLDSERVIPPAKDVNHLLHLCHIYLRPTLQQESINGQLPEFSQMFRLGSAMQLYEGGVSFEARSRSSEHSFLDITIDQTGKMYVPCLCVEDNTVSLLRNLIALEQMKYPNMGLDVSAYAVLLLHLITIPEDVKLLRRKGIIQHHLASDKEMVYLVNRLSVGLSFDYLEDTYSLKPVFQELKRYSDRRVPRWTAWLKHRHFNNPWTTISLLAASLLLLLTVVQTFYAVYSYYRPLFDGHA